MGATRILPNYTYTDYEQWEGRWELIEGIPFAMSPMANPRHQSIASRLNVLLGVAVDQPTCDCQVYQPIDVKINDNTVVNPDLLIVCEEIEGQYLERPFPMAVEILSPSTKMKDKVSKYHLYEQFGVKYYVMIDPDTNTVEQYVNNNEGVYEVYTGQTFLLTEKCTVELDFGSVLS